MTFYSHTQNLCDRTTLTFSIKWDDKWRKT